ncbi:MAG: hypothetical protein ACLQUT_07905 [Thermoleophilia bacterium]
MYETKNAMHEVIGGYTYAKLQKGCVPMTTITCTAANTDYAAGANVPAWATYVCVNCASACRVAIGEVTSATNGVNISAGAAPILALNLDNVAVGMAIHAQSAVAAAVVNLTYLAD